MSPPQVQRDHFKLSMFIILAVCILCIGSVIVCFGLSVYYDTQKAAASCQSMIIAPAPRDQDYAQVAAAAYIPDPNPTQFITTSNIVTITTTVTHSAAFYMNATSNSNTTFTSTSTSTSSTTGFTWTQTFKNILKIPSGFCRWSHRLLSRTLNYIISIPTKLKVFMNIEFKILPLRSDQEEVYVITHLREYDYRLDIHPVRACISVLEWLEWETPARLLRWYFRIRGGRDRDALALVRRV
ncbi:hypothetical protein AOL_s00054g206 [Orbilia oligospora ATCC 24927]|uniref:Uncharacterized protein n=1 Tax=Arthrobotrys oligospora (strain ATCC 24927 / CBS 115.81 / DSM 1491) TaxID=756982 RepID=G1X5R2_ARTOA|nr:hypothetical protein AOL_s00054g206 [Orbilia oligospora ATCC 24927]EGX51507.1 hypothetical protein AOL_s00054g206 [Orbilia oligospora ATCC 24927]